MRVLGWLVALAGIGLLVAGYLYSEIKLPYDGSGVDPVRLVYKQMMFTAGGAIFVAGAVIAGAGHIVSALRSLRLANPKSDELVVEKPAYSVGPGGPVGLGSDEGI